MKTSDLSLQCIAHFSCTVKKCLVTLMNYVRALLIMKNVHCFVVCQKSFLECRKIEPPIDICLIEGPIPPLCPWQTWSILSRCRSCHLWGSRVVGSKIWGEFFYSTLRPSLKLTPENWWLEDEFNFGMAYFQERTVSFGECKVGGSTTNYSETSFNTIWRTVPLKKQHVSDIVLSEKRKSHRSLFGNTTTGFDRPL